MKMLSIVCLTAFIAAPAHAATVSFPDEVSYLNGLVNDEAKLVEAVRDYDVLQQALMSWDEDLAKTAAASRDQDEVRRRMDLIEQRKQLVGKIYSVLMEYYPRNARALNYYGEYLCDQRGEIAGAIRMWKQSAAEDSDLSLPHNNLGIFYTHTGDYRRGLAEYKKAIELDPDNADFKFNLAQTYLINFPQVKEEYKWDDAKVFKEAMKLSREAAELRPTDYLLQQDYAVNFFAADRFGVTPDWKNAAKAWQHARKSATALDQVFYTWLNEARVWLEVPDYEHAVACLKEALKILPTNDVAQKLLTQAEAKAGKNQTSS